jgi:hypothetical protein
MVKKGKKKTYRMQESTKKKGGFLVIGLLVLSIIALVIIGIMSPGTFGLSKKSKELDLQNKLDKKNDALIAAEKALSSKKTELENKKQVLSESESALSSKTEALTTKEKELISKRDELINANKSTADVQKDLDLVRTQESQQQTELNRIQTDKENLEKELIGLKNVTCEMCWINNHNKPNSENTSPKDAGCGCSNPFNNNDKLWKERIKQYTGCKTYKNTYTGSGCAEPIKSDDGLTNCAADWVTEDLGADKYKYNILRTGTIRGTNVFDKDPRNCKKEYGRKIASGGSNGNGTQSPTPLSGYFKKDNMTSPIDIQELVIGDKIRGYVGGCEWNNTLQPGCLIPNKLELCDKLPKVNTGSGSSPTYPNKYACEISCDINKKFDTNYTTCKPLITGNNPFASGNSGGGIDVEPITGYYSKSKDGIYSETTSPKEGDYLIKYTR